MSGAMELLTVDEAAEVLKLSVHMVRRLAAEGKIPGGKVGRQWRFSRRQLQEWVEAGGGAWRTAGRAGSEAR